MTAYERWLREVSDKVEAKVGLPTDDLPDLTDPGRALRLRGDFD